MFIANGGKKRSKLRRSDMFFSQYISLLRSLLRLAIREL
jgi:hypothetical protein